MKKPEVKIECLWTADGYCYIQLSLNEQLKSIEINEKEFIELIESGYFYFDRNDFNIKSWGA